MAQVVDVDAFDTVLFDCDGVLWRCEHAVPGAADLVRRLRRLRKRVVFVSNNSSASRPQYVAKISARLGVAAHVDDVYCSSYAAARYLRDVGFCGKAYVVGGVGIALELQHVGIEPVHASKVHADAKTRAQLDHVPIDHSIGAVVVGFDSALTYTKVGGDGAAAAADADADAGGLVDGACDVPATQSAAVFVCRHQSRRHLSVGQEDIAWRRKLVRVYTASADAAAAGSNALLTRVPSAVLRRLQRALSASLSTSESRCLSCWSS